MENYEYRGNPQAITGVCEGAREDWTGVEDTTKEPQGQETLDIRGVVRAIA